MPGISSGDEWEGADGEWGSGYGKATFDMSLDSGA